VRDIILYCTEEGLWAAETMKLPGYTAYGRTEEEAMRRIKDAITMYFPCGECKEAEGGH